MESYQCVDDLNAITLKHWIDEAINVTYLMCEKRFIVHHAYEADEQGCDGTLSLCSGLQSYGCRRSQYT